MSPANFTVTTPGSEFEFVVNGTSSGHAAQDGNVDDSVNFTLNAGAAYLLSMSTAAEHPVEDVYKRQVIGSDNHRRVGADGDFDIGRAGQIDFGE